jgi:hypothetical protein
MSTRHPFAHLIRTLSGFVLALGVCEAAAQGTVSFTSSNLPIIVLDTEGRTIVDEPKVAARLGIIYNGVGIRNHLTDPFNGYDGRIGIEIRGASSQSFPKKSYAFETRDDTGAARNVSLLGIPAENEWILYAPYTDKSMLRDVLTYDITRRMGHYASRVRFCEVVLNGQYQGVYVLMEKIKRDKARVNVARLAPEDSTGDALTGGYILKIDKSVGPEVGGWTSPYPPLIPNYRIFYQYHDPKPSELTPVQKAYIEDFITDFERVMNSSTFNDPVNGYARFIDVPSFVDFFLVNEIGRNVDGYRISTFFHKDRDSRGGKLFAGPVWDFNLAFGNADYYGGSNRGGYQIDFAIPTDGAQVPAWWSKLVRDSTFAAALNARWQVLRAGVLHTDSLFHAIDTTVALLGEAQGRNYSRWPILGTYVWPNAFVGVSYTSEIDYLKTWMLERFAWLDEHLPQLAQPEEVVDPVAAANRLSTVYPNPSTGPVSFTLTLARREAVLVALYDLLGREVARLHDGVLPARTLHTFTFNGTGLSDGVYFCRAISDSFTLHRPFVLVR